MESTEPKRQQESEGPIRELQILLNGLKGKFRWGKGYNFLEDIKESIAEHILACFKYIRIWNKDFGLLTAKEEILTLYTILYHDLDEYKYGDISHKEQEKMTAQKRKDYEKGKVVTIHELVDKSKIPIKALDLYENFENRHNENFFQTLETTNRKVAVLAGIADCFQGNEFFLKHSQTQDIIRNSKNTIRLKKEIELLSRAEENPEWKEKINKFGNYFLSL